MIGFYESLFGCEEEIIDLILDFFLDNFKEDFGGRDYIFDVYVMKENKVKLMDFNIWVGLMFLFFFFWEELEVKFVEVEFLLNLYVECWIVINEGLV